MAFNIKCPIPMGSYDPLPCSQKHAKSTFSQMKTVHNFCLCLTKPLFNLCLADGCSINGFQTKILHIIIVSPNGVNSQMFPS